MDRETQASRFLDFDVASLNSEDDDDFFVDLKMVDDIDVITKDDDDDDDDMCDLRAINDDDDDTRKTKKDEPTPPKKPRRRISGEERKYPITFCFYKPADMISPDSPSSSTNSFPQQNHGRQKIRNDIEGNVRRTTHRDIFQIAAETIRTTFLKHPNRGDIGPEEREHPCFRALCFPFRAAVKVLAYLLLIVFWFLHVVFMYPFRCICDTKTERNAKEETGEQNVDVRHRDRPNKSQANPDDEIVDFEEDESDESLIEKKEESVSRPKGYEGSRAMREKIQRMKRKKYNADRAKEGTEEGTDSVSFFKSIMLTANKKTVDFSLRHTFVPEQVRRDDEILPEDATKKTRRAMSNFGFSHVELSTNDATYFIRWGTTFTKMEKKTFSGSRYGNQGVLFSKRDHDVIVRECEKAWKNRVQFDYVGNLANVVLFFRPFETIRKRLRLQIPVLYAFAFRFVQRRRRRRRRRSRYRNR